MYYYLIAFVLGLIVAWVVTSYVVYPRWDKHDRKKRKEKVLDYIQRNHEITNDEYQKLTGVSDAQATRDLDALEKEGKIVQIGETGRGVRYRLK